MSRTPEPINSGPCRFCYGDHPDESCRCPEKELVDYVGSTLPPKEAAAIEMWNRRQFKECLEGFYKLSDLGYRNDWEAYNLMCVDCDRHDKCFDMPEWYDYLLDRKGI